jgi:hypothetical protein
MVGVSGRMIQRSKSVLAKAPEVFVLMEKGKITVNAATLKAVEMFAVEAAKKRVHSKLGKTETAPQNSGEGSDKRSHESRDKAAKLVGTSCDTVQRTKPVNREAPRICDRSAFSK